MKSKSRQCAGPAEGASADPEVEVYQHGSGDRFDIYPNSGRGLVYDGRRLLDLSASAAGAWMHLFSEAGYDMTHESLHRFNAVMAKERP